MVGVFADIANQHIFIIIKFLTSLTKFLKVIFLDHDIRTNIFRIFSYFWAFFPYKLQKLLVGHWTGIQVLQELVNTFIELGCLNFSFFLVFFYFFLFLGRVWLRIAQIFTHFKDFFMIYLFIFWTKKTCLLIYFSAFYTQKKIKLKPLYLISGKKKLSLNIIKY